MSSNPAPLRSGNKKIFIPKPVFRWSSSQAQSDAIIAVNVHGRVPNLKEVELLFDHLHRRLHRLEPEPEEHDQVRVSRHLLSHQEPENEYESRNL